MPLYVLVFGSGAILMSLEMLGSRVMAPYFGSSVYVWGSLISVFMTSLSGGYYLGGMVADRWPERSTLSSLLVTAGALSALIPVFADPIAAALVDWGPRAGALAAAGAIFLPATVVLGMVSPLAIRLGAVDMTNLGQASGRLSAVSTAGSIVGTLVTTFWLVPLAGTKLLITGLAAALFVLAALSFLGERKYKLTAALLIWAVFLGLFGPSGAMTGQVDYLPGAGVLRTVYQTESAYHNIRVMDGDGVRYLRFDHSLQTGMSLEDPFESRLAYPDYFHLAMAQNPNIRDVLVIGLGGGAAPKRFWRDYPQVSVDAVELDPKVVEVAREFFALPEDHRLRVFAEDGRRFVESSAKRYDLILVDAYHSDSVPFHLATREFAGSLQAHLKPDGIVAFNLIGALEGDDSRFIRSMYKTVGEIFPTRHLVATRWSGNPDAASRRNIILFATDAQLSAAEFKAAVRNAPKQITIPGLETMMEGLYTREVATGDVPVLTDDHAPVDNLIKVMD